MQAHTDHRRKATDTARYGRTLASAIDEAILAELPEDADELLAYSHRIKICSQNGNIWTASDLHTNTGECYDGAGRFWQCSHKLCPYCLSRSSTRHRRRIRTLLDGLKLNVGENLHFITLTMPNQGISLLQARTLLNDAWAVFRKKKWFTDTIHGGVKTEEFTLTRRGYHYHAHMIVRAKFISYSSLRHFWTESLKHSFAKHARPLTIATADNLAMANSKRIGSIENAIREVAKYITKTDTWLDIPHSDLLDICRIRRFPRMFEFFGSFRNSCGVAGEELDNNRPNKNILDTRSLSDREDDLNWREKAKRLGAVQYLTDLQDQINDAFEVRCEQLRRHYPFASFKRLKPDPYNPTRELVRLVAEINDRRLSYKPFTTTVNFASFDLNK